MYAYTSRGWMTNDELLNALDVKCYKSPIISELMRRLDLLGQQEVALEAVKERLTCIVAAFTNAEIDTDTLSNEEFDSLVTEVKQNCASTAILKSHMGDEDSDADHVDPDELEEFLSGIQPLTSHCKVCEASL